MDVRQCMSLGIPLFGLPYVILGILAETTHGKAAEYGRFYIAASYVKYVEAAGGRVVPILYPKMNIIPMVYLMLLHVM